MGKLRVHELAKELGVTSKVLLEHLRANGEFVTAASSSIEAPVVRKIRENPPAAPKKAKRKPAAKKTAAKKTSAAKKTAAKKTSAPKPGAKPGAKPSAQKAAAKKPTPAAKPAVKPATGKSTAPKPGGKTAPKPGSKTAAKTASPQPKASKPAPNTAAPAPKAPKPTGGTTAASKPTAKPASPKSDAAKPAPKPTPAGRPVPGPRPGPRPGNSPFGASQGMRGSEGRGRRGDRPPRPGNSPFASSQGMSRSGGRRSRPGGPGAGAGHSGRPGTQGSRPGQGQGGRPGQSQGGRPGGPRPGNRSGGQGQGGRSGGRNATGSRPPRNADAGARTAPPRPGGFRPNPNMMPERTTVNRPGDRPGGRGGGPGGRGGSGGGRGRGPGRGPGGRGTQGAFGRGGSRAKARKSKRLKRQEFEQMQAPSIGGVSIPRGDGSTVIRVSRGASLTDFADKIDVNPASLVTVLFHLGGMATATQSLDEDTFQLLGEELGYVIQLVSPEEEEQELFTSFGVDLEAEAEAESDEDLPSRPPVVTVMGHVDHGKTALLAAIRKVDATNDEAGGITQHIGAYQVRTSLEGVDRAVTFIDTPGHEAFTAMRARGAKVTDIAILVVAANDGVMPQTIEALNHAQAANVPIVVAVNKIDVEGANPAKVRQQLTEYNLIAEEYGGDTMFVDVSAKQGENIDALLEAILLTADASVDPRANPDKDARGVSIEAHLDRGRGSVSTVLVQSGTLRIGDGIVAGSAFGRVRAMIDEHGESLQEAGPSVPVLVSGLTSIPRAGDTFIVAPDDRTARQIAEKRQAAERQASLAKARKRISLEELDAVLDAGKIDTLNLILKGDVSGSVEALEDALLQIDVGDSVDLRIISRGVGAITMNDINLAVASNAVIIGFNVRAEGPNADYADSEGIEIRYYTVIYQAIAEMEAALKGMLKPEYEEHEVGTAEVREIFRSSKFGNIAGSMVRSGLIKRGAKVRITRKGVVITENISVDGLRRFKDDVTEVREGFECGINLGSHNDLAVGDVITTYEMREKARD